MSACVVAVCPVIKQLTYYEITTHVGGAKWGLSSLWLHLVIFVCSRMIMKRNKKARKQNIKNAITEGKRK